MLWQMTSPSTVWRLEGEYYKLQVTRERELWLIQVNGSIFTQPLGDSTPQDMMHLAEKLLVRRLLSILADLTYDHTLPKEI